jgi:tetratricopeptide (TPR) repeat protein
MSVILEAIGKGLESSLMEIVLPRCTMLDEADEQQLLKKSEQHSGDLAYKLRLGIHYTWMAKGDLAQSYFEEILKCDPHHLDALLAWAVLYNAQGQLDRASERLEMARQYHPKNSRVLFSLGYVHERNSQMDLAEEFYLQTQTGRPYMRQALQRLGAIYIQQKKYVEAIGQYQNLQKEHPEVVWNYLILGQLHLQTNETSQAVKTFERALTIDPDNFEMHDDYVESLVQSGQYLDAINEIKMLIEKQGEFPDSYVRLADLYTQVNDDDAAVENYQYALELHPNYLEAIVKLGTQHLRMGRTFDAARKLNQGVVINDQLIMAYVGLGLAQYRNEQKAVANDTFDLAQALEPNTHLLFAEVARLQLKMATEQKPHYEFSDTLQLEETIDQQRDLLLDKQIERHRQALMDNPNHADLHYRYAVLLRGKNQREQAIKHYELALKINPAYANAHLKLALAQREKRQTSLSMNKIEQVFEINSEYVDLHYRLGLMYCDRLQFELAVEHFQFDANAVSQDNVHENLHLALQNMGLVDRVGASWQAFCELDPQSRMAFMSQRSSSALNPVR